MTNREPDWYFDGHRLYLRGAVVAFFSSGYIDTRFMTH